MRLDELIIGSDKLPVDGRDTHRYKNLKNVIVDFDQDEWITVVIGKNGTGKSNVLEALTHIFCELAMDANMPSRASNLTFAYKLTYFCHGKKITITADPDKAAKDIYSISFIEGDSATSQQNLLPEENIKTIKYSGFRKRSDEFLPKFIFGYYSGDSSRMQDAFNPYLRRYDDLLRNNKNPGLRQLFYALPVHSQFVLLAFMQAAEEQDVTVRNFLEKEIGLDPNEGFDSVLFVLKQPSWDRNPRLKSEAKKNNMPFEPDIFWGAEGVVRKFLDRLLEISLAPIQTKRDVKQTLWAKKGNETEFVYLYVKDLEALTKLRNSQTGREFFQELESTYVSELIEETRIRVKLKKNDGTVTFRELSEGEQQLLTVLGLLRFTAEEESLFLLDEPDTHLNPKWSVDYIQYLKDFVNTKDVNDSSSHIVLTTHNPLAVAELKKEQVQILHHVGESRQVKSTLPDRDPQGMGYNGVITSDLFDLGSSLDKHTTQLLMQLHKLSSKDVLTPEEKQALKESRDKLADLDFNFASSDRAGTGVYKSTL